MDFSSGIILRIRLGPLPNLFQPRATSQQLNLTGQIFRSPQKNHFIEIEQDSHYFFHLENQTCNLETTTIFLALDFMTMKSKFT